jgi:cold shock CspA family protein
MTEKFEGTVATVLDTYGFIVPKAGGDEIFFHGSAVRGALFQDISPGDEVTYALLDTSKGPRAVAVERVQVEECKD